MEAVADRTQQLVTRGVSEAVVHHLEIVEVEEDHRERGAAVVSPRQRVLEAVDEQRAIGQGGDRIVEGLLLEAVAEPRVLDSDTRLRGERVEEREILAVKAAHIAEPVADEQGSEERAIALQRCRHRVAQPLMVEPPRDSRLHGLASRDHAALVLDEQRREMLECVAVQRRLLLGARAAAHRRRRQELRAVGYGQQRQHCNLGAEHAAELCEKLGYRRRVSRRALQQIA